ncbi:hypothetical protein IQ277_35605 [Nostocales cyanobacterium LEGE 12452]|nr:hypothetical protein [Nostocales cyanobacterium LEGE 12452]
MRSFQFITPRRYGKIEHSWQCDRIRYFIQAIALMVMGDVGDRACLFTKALN